MSSNGDTGSILEKSHEKVKEDLVLACKRFPSVILGDSRPVELYSKTPTENNFLPTSLRVGWLDPDTLSGTLSSFCPDLQDVDSSNLREDMSDGSSFTAQTSTSEVETMSDDSAAQLFLSCTIYSMPGLSKRQSNQLDSCGFHTVGI